MAGIRIGGMASGIDTDTMVKQMMQRYTMKVDKMKQDKQIVTWRQELYRDILSDTANISKTYFDVLKPATNMLSKNTYSGFDVTSTSSVVGQSAGVSATASLGAVAGSYSVNVTQLATPAKVEGTAINESNAISDATAWKGKTVTFNIGGTEETITIDNSVTDRASLITNINSKLGGKINVTETSGGGIRFNSLTNNSVKVVSTTVDSDISKLVGKVINPNRYTTKLSDLGIGDDGTLTFEYKDSNGITKTSQILVSKDDTISQLVDAVNKGTSGAVKVNFSELTGEFSIESLQTGSSAALNVTGDGVANILTKLNLAVPIGGAIGEDAKVVITPPGSTVGVNVTKSGNSFSIDGVNYTLTKEGITNITVAGNTDKTYDKIKVFIDKYNELVEKVNAKTGEKKQYKFLPLTDDQKKDMSEDEVKQWEIKAKEGLLKGDSSLENMMNSMRTAFYQGVKDAGITLSEIGLSTSPDISKKGKIIIDETKLKAAIETRGEQVANLFTKTSTTYPSYSADYTNTQRNVRSEEQGIFQRLNDILQDYTRTSRNVNGKKGILLERAGIKGDPTELGSSLSKDIIKKDKMISEMIKSLAAKENKFYLQFSRLEVAMNKLNSQSSWLTQQFSQGQ